MTTQNVTVTLVDASLDAVVGARVQAKLFFPESLTDFIAPETSEVEGTTDAAGQAVLAVWPNALNTTVATYYKFRAWHPTTKAKILDVCAYVSADSNLEDISYDCRNASNATTGSATESAALAAHLSDPTDAHDASAISVLDTAGNFTADNVEDALAELYDSGITYFVEARNTTAPNATVPVHSWTATGAESNIDAVFSKKGTGAISAQVADGTATGGNKRGTYAVDWQTTRSAATQVASGSASFIGNGQSNTASSPYSVVIDGLSNTSSGTYSFVGSGDGNAASGEWAFIGTGTDQIASGTGAFIGGGGFNEATGDYAFIPGGVDNLADGELSGTFGYRATTRGIYGRMSYASGYFAVRGDAQSGLSVLRKTTTDATAAIATSTGFAASTENVSVLPNSHAYAVTAHIVARDASSGDTKVWTIEGAVKRGANAAATALVGTPTKTVIGADAGAAAWDVDLIADTTLGAAEIQVTGEAATTIHWVCRFDTVEVG